MSKIPSTWFMNDPFAYIPGAARKSIHSGFICCLNRNGDCGDVYYGNGTLRGTIGVSS